MTENEFTLFDRLEVIRNTINKYGEDNFYVSFSGGKDSTVLHYIIDEALPNNKIPRIYINTGIEYNDILKFVKEMQKSDNRIQIVNSNVHIPSMLKEKGYPFKSKEHAHKLCIYQNGGMTKAVDRYVKGLRLDDTLSKFTCPKSLLYQFTDEFDLKVSEKCCDELKKKTVHRYEKQSGKYVAIIGLRMDEGGERANRKGCVVFDSKNNLKKFKPLNPVSNDFMEWYIESRNIKQCRLYYEPFNFRRTGCKGCPFTIDLQDQLEVMARYLPAERKQCEILWKPVYDEYRRIGYRLKKNEQIKLF